MICYFALALLPSTVAAVSHAYVANEQDGTVSVIDTDKDDVVRTIIVPADRESKLQAVLVDRDEKALFVVDALNSTLVVIDLASGKVKRRIPTGKGPEGASLSPSGRQIAVCGEEDNVVNVIDVARLGTVRSIPTQGKNPEHCEFSPDGRWLLASNETSNDVDIIDLAVGKSVALVHTTGHPRGIAILPDSNTAYVAQEASGGVDVIDLASRRVTKSIDTGSRPSGALASADGQRVYISNGGAGTVSVIDTGRGQVLGEVPVGKRPWNMALTHDGRKLYVANGRSNTVSVVDTATLRTIKEIPVGGRPWGVQIASAPHRSGALLVAATSAAESADPAAPFSLPPVVVTATRSARAAFDVPASIDAVLIDQDMRDSPGINPSEYLRVIPGVFARDRQNYAQDEQLSIRGFGARSTFGVRGVRLYIDGIPATMPDGQGQVSGFPLDSAQRIEVLRGPFSALYGNSSGGVIQIFTADASATPQWQAALNLGSYGSHRFAASARGSSEMLGYNVALSRFHTDGYRGHSRAERINGNAKFDISLPGERTLSLLVNTVALPNAEDPLGLTRSQFQAAPRQPQPAAEQFDTRKSVHQQQIGAVYEQSVGTDQTIRMLAYAGQRRVEQFQSIPLAVQTRPTSPGGVIDLDGGYGGVDARWNWRTTLAGRSFELTAGASYDRQRVHRLGYNNFSGTHIGVKGDLRRDEWDDVHNFDQYLQANWDLAERWLINAGARRSQVRFSVDDRYINATSGDDSSRAAYGATTPVAGLLFRATPRWHLYTAYGNAFETPTFNELAYRPDGSAGINDGLVPARSRNIELGSKLRFKNGGEFDVAVFQAGTRHELAVSTSGGGRTTYQNIDRARRRGAEAKLDLPLGGAWRLEAAYTHLDATFRSGFDLPCPPPAQCVVEVPAGSRIPGVPKDFGAVALRFRTDDGWSASIEANAASATPVNDLNSEFAPGYATVDGMLGYTFSRAKTRFSTFLRLNNVADRHYAGSVIVNESNGRFYEPALGRNVLVGCTIEWQ
jgi:iron complex outermembrane receptor protein